MSDHPSSKKSSLWRLDIAPLTPLPLTRSPLFSYRSPLAIPLGSLVEIPFGRRTLRGIVYAAAPLPGRAPLWLKPIHRVIAPAWLTEHQRVLAQTISQEYISSLGNTLKHFVFPLPKKITALVPKLRETTRHSSRSPKVTCHEFLTDTTLLTWLEKKIRAANTSTTTLFILVPDLLLAELIALRARTMVPTTLLTSRLTGKGFYEAWSAIRTGGTRVIIGTRQALFAPFTNLKDIMVLFPEETLSYKQWDMTPRYETDFIVRHLTRAFGAKLTYLTTSLGLREQISFPKAAYPTLRPPLLVDRRQDGKGARAKVFGKVLIEKLKAVPTTNKVLLIAKERGVAGVLLCQSCRTTARCPECHHILGEQASGEFRCLACGYRSSLFPRCSACGHFNFKSFGYGTVRVEREYERLWPEKRTLRLDRDSLAPKKGWDVLLQRLIIGDFDTLITTPELGTLLPLPPCQLIAMLEGDHSLAFARFDSEERLALQVKRLTAKLSPQGILVVKTFAPEERIWRTAKTGTLAPLFTLLLEERTLLGYPPVAAMIQVAPLKTSGVGRDKLRSIRDRLMVVLKSYPDFSLTPVFERKSGRQTAEPVFLIKYPGERALPKELLVWINRESQHLAFDVHPLTP